jgi:glutamate carboxypeptidase
MKRILVSIVCFVIMQLACASQLAPAEKQMRDYIISQTAAQLALLEKLVNINSGTTNLVGVHKVGEILRTEFDKLGFTTRWVEEPPSMHKAGTLIAERHGKKGKRLLLIGHLDTVFAPDTKFQRFEKRANSAKGPGVEDNKGGDLVMLYALKALQSVHALDNTSITVVLTGDEEESGKPTSISRKPLFEVARKNEIALDFESAITLETGTIARRGIGSWAIITHGNESHSATIFQKEVGDGAIFEMARILNAMRTGFAKVQYLTFNPGMALGGTTLSYDDRTSQGTVFGKTNVVAKVAAVKGDYRFLTSAQKKTFEDKLTLIVQKHLPGTKSSLVFQDGIPAMQPTASNMALLKKYSAASDDLGLGKIKPLDPGLRGAGDISHVAALMQANLAGLGPMGFGSHSVMETIELRTLPIQTERAAVLIYRLTR